MTDINAEQLAEKIRGMKMDDVVSLGDRHHNRALDEVLKMLEE
jgi:Mg/Co/Ni transporter MgtE